MTNLDQNYVSGWDRIFNKPQKRQIKKNNRKSKHYEQNVVKNLSFDKLFEIRWDQLRFSNSRSHVTEEIKKTVKNFTDWQKDESVH